MIKKSWLTPSARRSEQGEQPFFTYPRVPGHELAVEVVGVGEHAGELRAGDCCAIEP